jgi:hypothetical protein
VPVKPPAPSKAVSAPIKTVSSPLIAMEIPIKSDAKLPSFNNPFAKKLTPTPLVVGDDSKVAKESKEKEKKISKPSQQTVQVSSPLIKNPISPAVKKSVANEATVKIPKMDMEKDDFGEVTNPLISPKLPNSNKGFFSFPQPKQSSKDITKSNTPTTSKDITISKTPIKSDPKLPLFNNPFAKKATPTPLVVRDAKESKEKEKKISKPSQQAVQVDKVVSVSEPIPPKKKSKFESMFSIDYSKRGTATLKTGSKKLPNSNEKPKKEL